MADGSGHKAEIELSQEDGPSVLALSVLSSYASYGSRKIQPSVSANQKIKYPLNLYNRHQRLILYNMIAFIWSLLYLIYYVEAIDNVYTSTSNNPNTVRTNELYVSYFAMIFFGSLSIIIIKCIELKQWISPKNKKFIKFVEFIHNMVGLIYLASFFIHIGITWKQSNEICHKQSVNDIWFCKTTFISSGFLCIYISWVLCCDTIYRNAQNTGSRIQYIVFFISILMYLICIIHYRNEWNIKHIIDNTPKDYNTLLIVGEVGWWLLLFSYFFALILDCITFTKLYYNIILIIISFLMVIGSILSVNRNIYIFDNKKFYYQGWFLLIAFTGFLSYQLHSKNLNRKRRIIGEHLSKESIAEEAPRYRHIEGSEDIIGNKNNNKKDMHPLLRNKGVLSYHNNGSSKESKRFKKIAFNVDHKKQRMIVYNLFIFVWSINMLVYFGDLLQYEKRQYYSLEISASVIMLLLSVFMIFMEWKNYNNKLFKWKGYVYYIYGCCFMYWLASILQISALIFQLTTGNNCTGFGSQCKVGVVGSQFLGIIIPFLLCFDIIWNIWDNIRLRILIQTFVIAISCALYYIGYSNYLGKKYDNNVPWYTRLSKYGWLILSILFLVFCVTLLFRDKCKFKSETFDGMILFIIGICYMISLGFSMSYPYGMYPIDNITQYDNEKYNDSLLLIPICFLISYEIQLLTNY